MSISTSWGRWAACVLLSAFLVAPAATARADDRAGDLAGLWFGRVQLDAVAAPGSVVTAAAAGTLRLPVLLHVDGAGHAVLLKAAVVLPDGDGSRVFADPAAHLADLRSADPQDLARALRLTSAGFDFPGHQLAFDGRFEDGAHLSVTLDIAADAPTNPFLHRYHPDHDNRDAAGQPITGEVYAVRRRIDILLPDQPPDAVLPGTDETDPQIAAGYAETISGLAAAPILVTGRLLLTRVDAAPTLE